jgi:hypothetical protein
MRTALLLTGLLLSSAVFAGDEAVRDTRLPQAAKRTDVPVTTSPVRVTTPIARDEERSEPASWLPGDSGLDYLAHCAAGCNG